MTISVPFEEHEDSPIERGTRDGEFTFTRIFVCKWDDRFAFVRDMFTQGFFGYPTSYSLWLPGLFAYDFNIERLANNPRNSTISDPTYQMISHDCDAKVTISYKPMSIDEGNLVDYEQQTAGEFVTVPSRGLIWNSDSAPLDADYNAAYPTTTTRHVVTWHRVVSPPWQTLAATINKVNSVAWRVPATQQLFAAGTILFAERSASMVVDFKNGALAWKLQLTFLEKAQTAWDTTGQGPIGGSPVYGWNWQWRDSTGTFDKPLNAQTGAETFQSADLRTIFV